MNIENIFNPIGLYDVYAVSIVMRDKLCGGKPKDPEKLKAHAERKLASNDEKAKELIAEMLEGVTVEEVVDESWNGFLLDEKRGLFIQAMCIKAMFKESASMLRFTTSKLGSKQIFQHGFEVKGRDREDRIYLGREKADGYEEGPIHVMTPQGPRTALKRVDYVEKVRLDFDVWVLQTAAQEKRHIGEEDIVKMLTFGQENGIGADRSQGKGKFNVVEFQNITEKKKSK